MDSKPARLAVKLTADGERWARSGHPWVFADSITSLKPAGKPGDLAVVFGRRDNRFVGIGLYDPASPIRIKMLHSGSPERIDNSFFKDRIKAAKQLRIPLLQTQTNSYRLIYGENDGFPGLVADVYAHVLVIKLYSAIWIPYLELLSGLLTEASGTSTAVLRLSRKLQQDQDSDLREGLILKGQLGDPQVEFSEHGLHFMTNVVHGHKTGYFLDHRHNRKKVGELASGKRVLDVFCYAGGFSVHALAGGAREVTSVDVSGQALEAARRNASLNAHKGEHTLIKADAFDQLEVFRSSGKKFDLVVIDPPSFAKEKSQVKAALNNYRRLCRLGAELCDRGGMLVMASCSSRIGAKTFFGLVKKTLGDHGKAFEVRETTFHDLDHPVTFPEGAYLKAIYIQFRNGVRSG